MRIALSLFAALAFLGALVYATVQQAEVECHVCVDFGGDRVCRTALASDRAAAVDAAVRNACSVLSDGVTQGMRCDRTPPSSVRCDE